MASSIDRYWKRLAAVPALGKFCHEAERLVRPGDPESFWKAQPAFQELLASDFLEAFVLRELGMIAENDAHFMFGSELHVTLAESEGYTLLIKLLPQAAAAASPLASLTEHLMLAVWRDEVEIERYTIEPPFRHDVFDRSKRLLREEVFTLKAGSVAEFRPPRDIFRLRLQRTALVVQLQSTTLLPLRWVFHPETLEPVRAVSSRLSSSRLQFTCHTLAALGSPSSIPALKRLMTHPEHYVRWAAVQSICAISREEGIQCLRHSMTDDHPHIRNAAHNTLLKLGERG